MTYQLPQEVHDVITQLEKVGFEAYVVGGAVRDVVSSRVPKDWDVATNARPEQIQDTFKDSFYLNRFGTVTVKMSNDELGMQNEGTEGSGIKEVEVTTYRVDGEYGDHRRPDQVQFSDSLREDLARRDFTVNAMALSGTGEVYDPFGGMDDLSEQVICAVGDPDERFQEDALRLLRAVRFATQLVFRIDDATFQAIVRHALLLKKISNERIRDELVAIVMSSQAEHGIRLLAKTSLLHQFLPELVEGIGVPQNKHHIYEVFDHNVRSLAYAARQGYSLEVRLGALFHDIGKPQSKRGTGEAATFYNHEMIGAKMTRELMTRLRFPKETIIKVTMLVRWHQFYYQTEEVTASSVRRLIKNVGKENIDDLIRVREADRIGSGVPKAVPYKLRHLKYMIEQVSTDPISPKMLAVKGDGLMKELGIEPGPRLGLIIKALLADVLDHPEHNTRESLFGQAKILNELSDEDLKKNLDRIEEAQQEQEEEIKRKYYVQ